MRNISKSNVSKWSRLFVLTKWSIIKLTIKLTRLVLELKTKQKTLAFNNSLDEIKKKNFNTSIWAHTLIFL